MSNRKEFTLEELEWKLVLLRREYARLLTSWATEERLDECHEAMASLGEWIDDRRALVIAYVDGVQNCNVWAFNHPEATLEEVKVHRAACIRAALTKAGISPTKSSPPYEDIEAEMHRRAQEYSEELRAHFDLESCVETGQW
ncbi:MAG: hypothetical protein ACO395_10280 [Pontimonas sp.]